MSVQSTTDTQSFQKALQSGDLQALRRIPKSDLHTHSILGTRIERIESWIGKSLLRPPARMASLEEMINYSHEVLYPYTVTQPGFQFTAESALQDAIEDGVARLEMSMDVRFTSLFEGGIDDFLTFVSDLVKRCKQGVDFRPEIGMSKDRPAAEQVRLASICVDSGLFHSIDLYGNETAQPPDPFSEIYIYARRKGLKLKAHAGEFAGPEVVERVLDILKVDEVQHGVAAALSTSLMDRLRRDDIRLNVCPSSNVALGVVKDISHHPIRTLFDNGVRVTVNTDDLTIFGQSVSEEYLLLYLCGLMTDAELDAIRLEGLR
jgi:adenosine deaminase